MLTQKSVCSCLQGFPHWQVVLVDLRCHGESAAVSGQMERPHSVESAAADVTRLLAALKLFPEVLIGHSFGGKCVLSIVQQFSRMATRLPRPVKVGSGVSGCLGELWDV